MSCSSTVLRTPAIFLTARLKRASSWLEGSSTFKGGSLLYYPKKNSELNKRSNILSLESDPNFSNWSDSKRQLK